MPIIVDAHEDIASTMLFYGRNYLRSAYDIRADEMDGAAETANGVAMLGLPEWLRGNVAVVFGTLWTLPDRKQTDQLEQSYRTSGEAHEQAMQQIEVYEELATISPNIRLIQQRHDLDIVLRSWRGQPDQRQVGIVYLMEGGDAIQEPEEIGLWYARGLRFVGPAWAATRYCGGTSEPGPLTDEGARLLNEMAKYGMVLDTSHMAEEAFFQALDQYEGRVIASHSNPRVLSDNLDRHLSDAMIKALIERDGIIGAVLFNKFLLRGWNHGDPKDAATAETVARAIDHVCQIAGDARHAGIGTDFDGGFGMRSTPGGFDTVADLGIIGPALAKLGYTVTDIELILGGNWLRLLREVLP
ncbi:MAG TPA: membrane dipeptidase [Anaerolineae bacterium]|nr:membrane dipeptidase [Anaerolineae bacterium]